VRLLLLLLHVWLLFFFDFDFLLFLLGFIHFWGVVLLIGLDDSSSYLSLLSAAGFDSIQLFRLVNTAYLIRILTICRILRDVELTATRSSVRVLRETLVIIPIGNESINYLASHLKIEITLQN
jgi:hypothetical protein